MLPLVCSLLRPPSPHCACMCLSWHLSIRTLLPIGRRSLHSSWQPCIYKLHDQLQHSCESVLALSRILCRACWFPLTAAASRGLLDAHPSRVLLSRAQDVSVATRLLAPASAFPPLRVHVSVLAPYCVPLLCTALCRTALLSQEGCLMPTRLVCSCLARSW